MLQPTVFSLCVLSYSDQIDIVVPGLVAWNAEAWSYICKQLQLFAQSQIEGSVAFADGRGHRTLEPNPVFLQQACLMLDCTLPNLKATAANSPRQSPNSLW